MDLHKGDTQDILKACRKHGLSLPEASYVMATACWETAHTVKPVREAYWLSESWRKSNLRYYPWYGRGYVQLTWEANYKKASQKLRTDFMANPDKVMEPKYSAEILVVGSKEGWFTGKKLSDYINDTKVDYKGARRIINGTDKASDISKLAIQYEAALTGIYRKTPALGFVTQLVELLKGILNAFK